MANESIMNDLSGLNEIPQPFSGIDVIGMGTFGNKKHPTDAYEAFSEQYDLPDEPILYIHSFFPKEEYKGKGLTKKYLLKTLSDWANHKLDNKELINNIGKRSLDNFGGSDFFGTSSFYDEGEKFFNNLIENGFLEKVHLKKKKEGRALNLFKITNKTKSIKDKIEQEIKVKSLNLVAGFYWTWDHDYNSRYGKRVNFKRLCIYQGSELNAPKGFVKCDNDEFACAEMFQGAKYYGWDEPSKSEFTKERYENELKRKIKQKKVDSKNHVKSLRLQELTANYEIERTNNNN